MDTFTSEAEQLPYLETFSKAAELGSFTGAAKALRLSQSAVSLRVQALEKRPHLVFSSLLENGEDPILFARLTANARQHDGANLLSRLVSYNVTAAG